jgi:hypothetical protein
MQAKIASISETVRESHLPKMVETEGGLAPEAPLKAAATGLERPMLLDLALKMANSVPNMTTEWAAQHMALPRTLVAELLDQLRQDQLLEVLGQAEGGYRYAISARGRERAARSMEISGYVGPTPVTLESYLAMLEWQVSQSPHITPEQVRKVLADLVLTEDVMNIMGLAVSSGRSLFLFGPAGNGKTTVGRRLHEALEGTLWIPHCIAVDNHIIRLFDTNCHQPVKHALGKHQSYDQRWVKIKRPFVVAGGEMTLKSLDLAYMPALRYYEAPLHMKANGGTFLIDDFGRQRVAPEELLNRWIVPLEHQFDYLTLHTGQKIQVPFLLMLIIATNLDPKDVTDPAFLRRLGYRARINSPTPELYARIFEQYASKTGLTAGPDLIANVLERYKKTGRELRGCEPRDLIERVRDVCTHTGKTPIIDESMIDMAWKGYFGNESI